MQDELEEREMLSDILAFSIINSEVSVFSFYAEIAVFGMFVTIY